MFNPKEHLMNLKGKEYLQVMWRLVWFREEKPNWCIDTQLISHEGENAVFCAKVMDENGAQKASGYGSESRKDFGDYLEKAETKAIGRALAMLGYGTQFAPELDEGERIVDSPVAQPKHIDVEPMVYTCQKCGGVIQGTLDKDGKSVSAKRIAAASIKQFGLELCAECAKAEKEAKQATLEKIRAVQA